MTFFPSLCNGQNNNLACSCSFDMLDSESVCSGLVCCNLLSIFLCADRLKLRINSSSFLWFTAKKKEKKERNGINHKEINTIDVHCSITKF